MQITDYFNYLFDNSSFALPYFGATNKRNLSKLIIDYVAKYYGLYQEYGIKNNDVNILIRDHGVSVCFHLIFTLKDKFYDYFLKTTRSTPELVNLVKKIPKLYSKSNYIKFYDDFNPVTLKSTYEHNKCVDCKLQSYKNYYWQVLCYINHVLPKQRNSGLNYVINNLFGSNFYVISIEDILYDDDFQNKFHSFCYTTGIYNSIIVTSNDNHFEQCDTDTDFYCGTEDEDTRVCNLITNSKFNYETKYVNQFPFYYPKYYKHWKNTKPETKWCQTFPSILRVLVPYAHLESFNFFSMLSETFGIIDDESLRSKIYSCEDISQLTDAVLSINDSKISENYRKFLLSLHTSCL